MNIARDCRHIRWDRPCRFHKDYGVRCKDCPHYDKIGFKILIIKLDAVGDVLRTTSVLHGLKEKYKDSHITWVTRPAAFPLFEYNNLVDAVLDCSAESLLRMRSEVYDLVFNPDSSPKSAILATLAKGKLKRGFGYNEKGHVYPFNKEAQKWFEMGLFDDIKKANIETYQKIISDMVGISSSGCDIIFNLNEGEKAFAKSFAEKHGVSKEDLVIGLNTGAGERWQNKKWTREGYLNLIRLIKKELRGCKILLFGGPEERERNRYLMEREKYLIDTGCDNTLREFGVLLVLCDILVTGDTMALHIALALNKKVIALFGPTSQAEIELYGRGKKIFANMDCLCCYRPTCDIRPSCMDMITPQQVFTAIKEIL